MAKLNLRGYLHELFDLRDKLKDFVERVGEGKRSYFKDIAIKLRILLCRKSRSNPLITEVERRLGMQVIVFITYSAQEQVERGLLPASLAENLIYEQVNSVVWWFERGNEAVPILDAIDKKEILFGNERRSYREVIEVAADKLGGAHVDENVKDHDWLLHSDSWLIGGLPIAHRALVDTAKACVILIDAIEDAVKNGKRYRFLRNGTKLA